MNEVNSYAYQNRVLLAQVSQLMAKNMELFQSGSTPYVNSAYRLPLNMSQPTMFGQLQGVISDVLGDELGGIIGQFASNPAVRAIIPAPINETLTTLMNIPQLGGVSDPGAFVLNQVSRNIGRGVPSIAIPYDFANIEATDAYIAQSKAFADYAGQVGFSAGAPTRVQALSLKNEGQENMNRIVAARNAIRAQQENQAFNNTFALFNSMNVFGPRIDTDKMLEELLLVGDEEQAKAFMESNKGRVDALLSKAKNASGLMQAAEFFSGFMGGSPAENAAARSLGDAIKDSLNIGNNIRTFIPTAAQALAGIGGLNIAMAAGENGENMPIANILAARVASAIEGKNSIGRFDSISGMGFRSTQELISTLSNSGMLSTGGVDVYGSLGQEDVKKLEEAMLRQLEGFGELVKTGKRIGLRTDELIKNLQAMYGNRTNEVLSDKASDILRGIENNLIDGVGEGDRIIEEENARRRQSKDNEPEITGADERRAFLMRVAKQRAGGEIAKELAEAVQLGRMAGIDARGVMAMATTATQILQNMGLSSEGGLDLATQGLIFSLVPGVSRLSAVQGTTLAAGIVSAAVEDPSAQAYVILQEAIDAGFVSADNPAAQALMEQFNLGKNIDPAAVAILTGVDVYDALGAEVNQHISKYIPALTQHKIAKDVPAYYKNKLKSFTGGAEILDAVSGGDDAKFLNALIEIQDADAKLGVEANLDAIMENHRLTRIEAARFRFVAVNTDIAAAGNFAAGLDSKVPADVLLRIAAGRGAAIEAYAIANENFSKNFSDAIKAGQPNTDLKKQFDAMREAKIKKLMKDEGISQEEAEVRVDDKGYSLTEYGQGLSGIATPAAIDILDKRIAELKMQIDDPNVDAKQKKILEAEKGITEAARREFTEKQKAPDASSSTSVMASTDQTSSSDSSKKPDETSPTTSAKGPAGSDASTAGGAVKDAPASPDSTGGTKEPVKPGLTAEDLEKLTSTLTQIETQLKNISNNTADISNRVWAI
jgi:hypothetical protein